MTEREEFQQIYQELKQFFGNSGDLSSALLPFMALTNDVQLAATMLHSQIETFDGIRPS